MEHPKANLDEWNPWRGSQLQSPTTSMLWGNLGRTLLYTCIVLTLIAELCLFCHFSTPISPCFYDIWENCFTKASEWGQMATHGLVLSIPCKCASLKKLKLRNYLALIYIIYIRFIWLSTLCIYLIIIVFSWYIFVHMRMHERMCTSTSQDISIWTTLLTTLPQLCHIVSRFVILEDDIGIHWVEHLAGSEVKVQVSEPKHAASCSWRRYLHVDSNSTTTRSLLNISWWPWRPVSMD